jgi:hypothetical protein
LVISRIHGHSALRGSHHLAFVALAEEANVPPRIMIIVGHRASPALTTPPRRKGSRTMNDEQQSGVGFFRGLLAVLRGTAHAFGRLLSLIGRGLAAVTRRSRHKKGDGTQEH